MLERNTERRIIPVDAGGGLVNVVVGFDPRYIIVDNMSEVDVSVYDGNRQTIPTGTAPFDYVPLHGFKVEPPPVGVRAFTFTWPGSTAGGFVKIVVTDDPKWVRAAHETNAKNVTVIGNTLPDGWENPFSTAPGQKVSSVSETWEARMGRLGLVKNAHAENVALTAAVGVSILQQTIIAGYTGWPLYITISATGPGLAIIAYKRSLAGPWENITRYFGAAGVWEWRPNGALMVGSNQQLQLNFTADAAAAKGHASLLWSEVAN